MASVERALALNPNNAQCHNAKAMVCLYQDPIDGEGMKQASLHALRISPKDPRATL